MQFLRDKNKSWHPPFSSFFFLLFPRTRDVSVPRTKPVAPHTLCLDCSKYAHERERGEGVCVCVC